MDIRDGATNRHITQFAKNENKNIDQVSFEIILE